MKMAFTVKLMVWMIAKWLHMDTASQTQLNWGKTITLT